MLVSNQHFDAGFFAGMRTIIKPCVKPIFEQVLSKFNASEQGVFFRYPSFCRKYGPLECKKCRYEQNRPKKHLKNYNQ